MNYYNVLLAKQTNKIEYFDSLYDCLFEKWINRARQILKDLPTGSISTVNDAAELPLNALKVSVEAVQDLHGYDHSWVGGAGKNKLPLTIDNLKSFSPASSGYNWRGNSVTIYGVTFEILTDNANNVIGIKATGTASKTAPESITFYTYGSNTSTSADISIGANMVCSLGVNGSDITYRGVVWKASGGQFIDDSEVNISQGDTLYGFGIRIANGYAIPTGGITFYPMLRTSGTSATFEPYSNICPISGWDSGEITVCDDIQSPTQTETITQQFPQTIYGAEWDVVNGEMKQTDGYIASYNGETLPSTWISDRDVYASGTTPTTGAEVVYKLATPTTIQLPHLSIRMLQGTNNLYADCGEVLSGKYWARG